MPKRKPKLTKVTDIVIEDPALARIEVMAKLAVARVSLQAALDEVDAAIGYFIDPTGDTKGEKRAQLIGSAEEAIGDATIALDYAGERLSDADTAEAEPDEEAEAEDEDDDEDGDEDEDEDEEDDD